MNIETSQTVWDKGAMESFFGRLKVEMFYREPFETIEDFIQTMNDYIDFSATSISL